MIIRIKEPEYPFETNSYKKWGEFTGGLINDLEELVNYIFPNNDGYKILDLDSDTPEGYFDIILYDEEDFLRFIRNKEYDLIRTDEGVDVEIIYEKDDHRILICNLPDEVCCRYIGSNDFQIDQYYDYYEDNVHGAIIPDLIEEYHKYILIKDIKFYKIDESRLIELLEKEQCYDKAKNIDLSPNDHYGFYISDYQIDKDEINNELAKYKI